MNTRKVLARSANDLLVKTSGGAYITVRASSIVEGPSYTEPRHYVGTVQSISQDVNKALNDFNKR